MPNFPPISTLSQKPHLTGEEEIQISATEKTTLAELISQLGFNTSSLLTGLNTALTPGIGIPTASDTLLSALAKLIARAGSNKLFIMPAPSDTLDPDEGEPTLSLVILADTFDPSAGIAGYVGELKFRESSIYLRLFSYDEPIVGDYSSITDLYNYVKQSSNPLYFWGYTNDKEVENATSSITFNPGSVIYHTGSSITNIIIPLYFWNQTSSGTFSQYTATIVTKVNVTRAMFNQASGGLLNNVTYLFMDGFDDDPGTDYQCITIQRVRKVSNGGNIVLLVNKCGYSES